MSRLFSHLSVRGVEFKNRIFVSPMCQYSSIQGMPSDWHLVHLGSRAVGGAAMVMVEASAISPEGRISPDDSGIWNDQQAEAFERITSFIKSQDCIAGIQISHAGRKASTFAPWKGSGEVKVEQGGWQTIAPSPIMFAENYPHPKEMTQEDIHQVIEDFKEAAQRSLNAGFRVIELHMAHGYLIHQFLSPLSNHRTDEYGGSLENRCRLAIEVTRAVRSILPDNFPLFIRISSTDWVEKGWDELQSVALIKYLKPEGADLIDCSSGGNVMRASIPVAAGYQIPFSRKIKKETGILTGGVGLITAPEQAEQIIATGQADAVFMARELLRDPYWPLHAAKKLNFDIKWPDQYLRAR
ncbi:MAG: NADH:flavin oxidoreductase/NADH oxidase [Methanococcaceae archaeon]